MRVVACHQLSAAWFQCHVGVATGSYMKAVLDFTKERTLKSGEKRGGEPGSTRLTYQRAKLAELLTGKLIQKNYVSEEMIDGIDREPSARAAYELEEGAMVDEIGFAYHDAVPRFGGSFDGLVGDDGILEIKCPKVGTHAQWVLDGVVPEQHIAQIDSYLSISGRKWCDFVSYCPEVPKPLRLMVIRRERDQAAIDAIEQSVIQFNAEVDAMIERLRGIVGPFDLPRAQQQEPSESTEDAPDAWLSEADLDLLPK